MCFHFRLRALSQAFYKHVGVKQVDVPTNVGMAGILHNHVPTLGVLMPGVVKVYELDGSTQQYFGQLSAFCLRLWCVALKFGSFISMQ